MPFFKEWEYEKNEHVNGICCGYTKDGHGVVKIDGFPLFVERHAGK